MDAATQAQIAHIIFEAVANGTATMQQRLQLMAYISGELPSSPIDEGPLSRELDDLDAVERLAKLFHGAPHLISSEHAAPGLGGVTYSDLYKCLALAKIHLQGDVE